MQYNGGKGSCAKEIAEIIKSRKKATDRVYWEPFCGAFSVGSELSEHFPVRIASDADRSIISMFSALQSGWVPLDTISEEEYRRVRKENNTLDPMHAFCKFGCSFGGKPWGGYARSGNRNYAGNARNSLFKQRSRIQDVLFLRASFLEIELDADVIYCDPPYAGTTSVGTTTAWDEDLFWDWARDKSRISTVFVSNIRAPDDFTEIWSKPLNDGLGSKKLTERLFVWKGEY